MRHVAARLGLGDGGQPVVGPVEELVGVEQPVVGAVVGVAVE